MLDQNIVCDVRTKITDRIHKKSSCYERHRTWVDVALPILQKYNFKSSILDALNDARVREEYNIE